MTDPVPAELRTSLDARAAALKDRVEVGEGLDTFESARCYEADDSHTAYADAIFAQVRLLGPIEAACEDLGDAIGFPTYDEAAIGIRAVLRQWERVADAFDVVDSVAIEVRMAVERLREELTRTDLDTRMLAHLVARAVAQGKLNALALHRSEALEAGDEDEFWDRYEGIALKLFDTVKGTSAELIGLGRIDLDLDPVIPD